MRVIRLSRQNRLHEVVASLGIYGDYAVSGVKVCTFWKYAFETSLYNRKFTVSLQRNLLKDSVRRTLFALSDEVLFETSFTRYTCLDCELEVCEVRRLSAVGYLSRVLSALYVGGVTKRSPTISASSFL